MKKTSLKTPFLQRLGLALLAGAALFGASLTTIQAQTTDTSVTNNFDTSTSTSGWTYWYDLYGHVGYLDNPPGYNTVIMTWDPTMNNGGAPGSGSVLFDTYWPGVPENTTDGGQNQIWGTFATVGGNQYDFSVSVDGTKYDSISFDVHANADCPTNAAGNICDLTVGFFLNSFAIGGATTVTVPISATNGWYHVVAPVNKTDAALSTLAVGWAIDINCYSGPNTILYTNTTPTHLWIDNIQVNRETNAPPPPTVSFTKTVPGLAQFANAGPNYNRQDIYTYTNGSSSLTWVGQPKPVKYSWTIASFPPAAYSNFFAGLTLTPDAASSVTYADPDWSAANVVWVGMQNNADGTVTAGIAWKTNQPANNTQLYAAPGQLIPYNVETNGFTVPSAVGTWTLTFTSDTDMTLTAPNGAVTNASLPSYVAALYNGYVGADLYSAATVDPNIGQYCTFSAYSITGVGTPVNENFAASGTLSSPYLSLISQGYALTVTNPPNQIFVTAADADWFIWSLPSTGYSPVTSASLSSPVWNDLPGTALHNGTQNWLKVSKSSLASPSQGFFAMVQRQFTQLQILLPGETNAPGTATGKIGTPIPQSIAGTDVTVNAVDATFHIVGGVTDTIRLTTSDESAFLPSDTAMSNGTVLFTGANQMLWGSQGTWTITATDETTATILPVTSSPVVVGP